jgi:hypothetical protein
MRSARGLLFATATVLAVALTGCSAALTGTPAPTGGGAAAATEGAAAATTAVPAGGLGTSDPVVWADKLCGTLVPTVKALSAEPPVNRNDPGALLQALSSYYDSVVSSFDQSLSGIEALGPSPIPNTDPIVSTLRETLTKLRTSFVAAKNAVDKVDPNNPADLVSAVPEALAPLASLESMGDPTAGLKTNPELAAAAAKAPNCQAINQ